MKSVDDLRLDVQDPGETRVVHPINTANERAEFLTAENRKHHEKDGVQMYIRVAKIYLPRGTKRHLMTRKGNPLWRLWR